MVNKLLSLIVLSVLFLFIFTYSSNAGIPAPMEGACCVNVPSGDCIVSNSESECNMQGGFFFASSTCAENPCDEPLDSTGDCCEDSTSGAMPTFTTGCNNSACELAVCQDEAFCCLVFWDDSCVEKAQQLCGGLCGGETPGPIAIVPTMNQWGIIITACLLGFLAVIAGMKREDNS